MKISSPPLDISSVRELYALWQTAFGEDVEPDIAPSVLAGNESAFNDVKIYRELMAGSIVATAISVSPFALCSIGAIGEVATHPSSRNRGLATGLCRRIIEDFRCNKGEALFLGTENPDAARIYEGLEWRYVPNTQLMVNLTKEETSEEFLERYFRRLTPVGVRIGQSVSRIPVIPLAIVPHDWAVLDANTSIISTRIEKQFSCLRLYNRYQRLRETSQGEWFSLSTEEEKVLGLASAVKVTERCYQVDGFCHITYTDHFKRLIEYAISWCVDDGAEVITMKLSADDHEKIDRIKIIGFKESKSDGCFQWRDEKKAAVFYTYG